MKSAIKQSTLTNILSIGSMLLIIITFILFVFCNIFNNDLKNTLNEKNLLAIYANQLKNASGYLTDEVRAYAATGDKVYYDNYWNEINNLKNRDIAIERMNEIGITEEEKDIINTISNTSNGLIPIEENVMEITQSGDLSKAISIIYGKEYISGTEIVLNMTEKFISTLDQRVQLKIDKLVLKVKIIEIFCIIFLILVVFVQIIVILFIRKKVILPIIAIKNEMIQISNGNLSAEFNISSDSSEVGMLADSIYRTKTFLKMIIGNISSSLYKISEGDFDFKVINEYVGEFSEIKYSLNNIINEMNIAFKTINNSSAQVAGGSERISQISQTLSQGAFEQAEAISEISNSITNISEQMNFNSTNAEKASKSTNKAGENLAKSNLEMDSMVGAMKEISEESQKISDIIKTIETIAFQTNILALNAAIEAARAGEAGKGFAVVAEEVRNLAGMSTEAASNTSELIKNIIISIDKGKKISNMTSESLKGVIISAEEVANIIQKISESTTEQLNNISQVISKVEKISSVVQNNSATSQESAASSEELNSQVQILNEIINKFKLKN